jgi:hypothetical protein
MSALYAPLRVRTPDPTLTYPSGTAAANTLVQTIERAV